MCCSRMLERISENSTRTPTPTQVLNRHAHTSNMRLDPIRKEIVGICCNLRGVAAATHNTRTYTMLFDVLYPNVFPIFAKAIAQCHDFPALTTAVLKFMIEFVENKMQRITFGHSPRTESYCFVKSQKLQTLSEEPLW